MKRMKIPIVRPVQRRTPLGRVIQAAIALLFGISAAMAQPTVGGVTNAADYSFTVAPGSIATIFGSGFAASQAWATTLPLQTGLNGVSVTVNGRLAPLFYVSPTQINFQVPYETAAGTAQVAVSTGGKTSNALQTPIALTALGIFQYGAGLGVIQNQDYTLNTSTNPAPSGSVIIVYLTGIGLTDHAVANGSVAPSSPLARPTGQPTATIGDAAAQVQFLGLTPGSVGLAQANIQIPSLPSGIYPLTIALEGHPSTSVLVSIAGNSGGFSVSGILSLVGTVTLPGGLGIRATQGVNGLLGGKLALLANHLYVCAPANITIVDVTNPAAPKIVSEFGDADLNNLGQTCAIGSPAANPFLEEISGLYDSGYSFVYDLTNPTQPVKKSQVSITVMHFVQTMVFNGSVGFWGEASFLHDNSLNIISTLGNISAIDFSSRTSQVLISSVQPNASQPATNNTNWKFNLMMAAPGILYAASTTGNGAATASTKGALDIFDVSYPAAIQAVSQILIPGTGTLGGLALSGNELLVTGNSKYAASPGYIAPSGVYDWPYTGNLTLTMFDVTNPRSPVLQGNVMFPALQPDGPCSAQPLGGGFYAVSCNAPDVALTGPGVNNSLVIVDGRDPTSPKAYTYGTVQGLGGMQVANGYLYAATSAGANVYKINLP